MPSEIVIRPMEPDDVDEADRVMRVAFGTYFGATEPETFFGDAEIVRTRFAIDPECAFVAENDRLVVGSIFVARWGSFSFLGPLTVRPDLWSRGIAKRLMEPVVDLFDRWQVRHSGLFTFAESVKHVGLYQRFGYWPQYLTAIMSKPVGAAPVECDYALFSDLPESQKSATLAACRDITDAIYDGLDLTQMITSVEQHRLGDTVLLYQHGEPAAFAVCHCGAGEAGSQNCHIKFGAVRPNATSRQLFEELLQACEALPHARGIERIEASINIGRHEAYRTMLDAGFRVSFNGVRMHRPNDVGFCRPNDFVIDDLT
ncbi:MAG TPA: GNAT family N-acetyltransferase [Nitrolancea sp.]|nr:GNAT family N-acetyltransferase [Nitrolancea sp.]